MNNTLTSIFETQGSQSLEILDNTFLNDNIFEEFITSCYFDQVNFMKCSFEDCDLVGVNFNFCFFEDCTFTNTIIRKSEFTDCRFKNCQFLESQLTPRTNFFRTLFMNCQFSSIDFSFAILSECRFVKINLNKIKFKGTSILDPKIENITLNELEFDQTQPMRIQSKKNDIF